MALLSDAAAIRVGTADASAVYRGSTELWSGSDVVDYEASSSIFSNPERGFYQYTETHYRAGTDTGHNPLNATTLNSVRASEGRSMVYRYFVLERYRDSDTIDQAYLDLVDADLTAVRSAGCKIIIRFCYSTFDEGETGGIPTPPYNADVPLARTLAHIEQLAPTVNAHAPVVEAVQAGFIGMWGEWYYSDHYGDLGSTTTQQWNDRIAVLNKMHDEFDPSIFILVRYPGIKMRWMQ